MQVKLTEQKKIHIDHQLCVDCGWCLSYCIYGAIYQNDDGKITLNQKDCCGCEECLESCPRHAMTIR